LETLELGDGRLLAYDVYGDPSGVPVIFSHGLSDSRLIRNPDEALTASLGVRVIAADQPGVGGSTPQPGRRMVDWGRDMEALADALGLERFVSAGHSGGGPQALAVAYRLPERVTHVVLASPVSSLDDPEMARLLINKDLKLVVKARHLHRLLRLAYHYGARKAAKDLPGFMEAMAEDDPSDAATFLADPAQKAMFEASFAAGLAQSEEGMYELTMALWDWGFEAAEIQQPVELFYGDADAILDPKMCLHLAEQLPHCRVHVWPGAGHYGFVDRERWTAFLTAASGAAPGASG
jgi:pimeloyl-ACP methyl ester carboxylesterase